MRRGTRMNQRCGPILATLAFAIVGCDPGAVRRDDARTARDSAGVRIVEYARLDAPGVHWIVPDSAALDIGLADGDSSQVFGRVTGVAASIRSGIVVADADAQELRAFGPDGRHRWTAGGEGGGPGQFSDLSTIFTIAGDSVVAVDHFGRTLSVFDATGRFRRTFRLAPGRPGFGGPAIRGVLPDGTVVVSASQDLGAGVTTGYRRGSLLLSLHDREGVVLAEIGEFADFEVTVEERAGRPIFRPMPMGRSTVIAVGRRHIATVTTDRFEIRVFDSAGRPRLIVRVRRDASFVDDAIRSTYVRHRLEQIDDEQERARVRPLIERAALPEMLPVLANLRIDTAGRIWVQEFAPPWAQNAGGWWVFDEDGEIVASATIPGGFLPFHIADDHVLGSGHDDLGVPRVQIRGIIRP